MTTHIKHFISNISLTPVCICGIGINCNHIRRSDIQLIFIYLEFIIIATTTSALNLVAKALSSATHMHSSRGNSRNFVEWLPELTATIRADSGICEKRNLSQLQISEAGGLGDCIPQNLQGYFIFKVKMIYTNH